MTFGNGLGVGITACGLIPIYMGTTLNNSSVHRDATDAKNIIYTFYNGSWLPGDAYQWPITIVYVWYSNYWDGQGYLQRQSSTSNTYNAGADQSGNGDHGHYVIVLVYNNNGVGSMTTGLFGNNTPYTNPWVWYD